MVYLFGLFLSLFVGVVLGVVATLGFAILSFRRAVTGGDR
jgi:hypothetical protein